jgi:serine/threonine-protein kinase HipA
MKENKLRTAIVKYKNINAGILEETIAGYRFTYNDDFLNLKKTISLSLPINKKIHESDQLFSFFIGLLPEGWYLDLVSQTLKIDKKDNFGLLLITCKDTIGAVTIEEAINE